MENSVAALVFPDGTIGRMQFTSGGVSDEYIQDAINRTKWVRRDGTVTPPTSWRRVTLADFPADATFRDAWIMADEKIVHDIEKARDIQRERIRAARVPALAALDIDQKNALVAGDRVKVDEIEGKLQLLRDAPADPAIDAAKTINDLKAVALPDTGGK